MKYAKILAKTIVNPDGDDSNRGQNLSHSSGGGHH